MLHSRQSMSILDSKLCHLGYWGRRHFGASLKKVDYTVDPRKITFIDSIEAIHKHGEMIARSTHLGFDSETKPAFRKGQPRNPVSTWQVAAKNANTGEENTFVFDLLKIGDLSEPRLTAAFDDIMGYALTNNDTLKIGQGEKGGSVSSKNSELCNFVEK